MDVEFVEEAHHVGVGAEEDVEPRLDPVAVLVLPCRDLAAQDVPGLVDDGLMAGIGEVFRAGEPGEASCDG